MSYKIFFLVNFFFCLAISAQQNVMISNVDSPNEPSIVINPNNTNQLIAAANINLYYKSNDAGLTWTSGNLTSTYGVWGDPCVIADNSNNFYFFHLSNPSFSSNNDWIDRIVCQKTTNFGSTWSNGSFTGLNGTKEQDKEWAIFDKTNNNIYATWTQFDQYGSSNPQNKSTIKFSKSSDYGINWTTAVKINTTDGSCIDDSSTVEGAVPATGLNGEIYVSWAGPAGIVFKKSLDFGLSWSTENLISSTTGWDYSVSGIDRCNGMPITACDVSTSDNAGTIYVNWSDQTNGVLDSDIFFSKSTDQGTTWSSPLRVNNDAPGKQQFMSWMTIDQTNGYIYIVYYDRRNYPLNSLNTDVYLAYSIDGGNSFTNQKISSSPFVPINSLFFGDYSNITAHNGVIRPIWTRIDANQPNPVSIWTAIISQSALSNNEYNSNDINENSIISYPNPSNDICYFSFKLHSESKISIKIYDLTGKEVHTVVDNKTFSMGKHIEKMKSNVLPNGEYIYTITSDYYKKSKKMIVEN